MLLYLFLTGTGSGTGTGTAPDAPKPIDIGSIILFGVLILGIIGLFVWQSISGKKKQKQAQERVDALKIGDRVKTIGGVCGFVAEINNAENTFVLETGLEDKKSYVKFDKAAIYQTAPAEGNAYAKPVEEQPQEKAEENAKDKE